MHKQRAIATWIAVAIVALLLFLLPSGDPRGGEGTHPGSTYMSSRDGAKAIYRILERLGFSVERRTVPMGNPGKPRLFFVLAPEDTIDPDEVDLSGLLRWVEGGGTFVYAGSGEMEEDSPLSEAFGFGIHAKSRFDWAERKITLEGAYAPAKTVTVRGESQVVPLEGQTFSRISADDDAIMERRMGMGRVIAVASATIAENELLANDDNALFFALLAERYGESKPVVFDEYVHGMTTATKLLPVSYPFAIAACLLAGLGFVFYAIGASVRLGPPSPEPAPVRRSTLEQVTALARLYERSSARMIALARLGAESRPVSSDAELVRLAQQHEALRKTPHAP